MRLIELVSPIQTIKATTKKINIGEEERQTEREKYQKEQERLTRESTQAKKAMLDLRKQQLDVAQAMKKYRG